jgi:hypothetical protein
MISALYHAPGGEGMSGSNRKSFQRQMPKGLSAALLALLATAIAFGTTGCLLPVLTMIPSVISLAHTAYTSNAKETAEESADAKNQEAETPTVPADAPAATASDSKPAAANFCQMMALAHPNMMLVELRKDGAGSAEYRELHLLNTADEAHWTPVVGSETGRDGWLPAVNFLKMDFNPPLTAAIPAAGSCYLAYAPSAIDPNDSDSAAQLRSRLGNGVGTFSWGGQIYEYTVARTPPCLAPSSQESAAPGSFTSASIH